MKKIHDFEKLEGWQREVVQKQCEIVKILREHGMDHIRMRADIVDGGNFERFFQLEAFKMDVNGQCCEKMFSCFEAGGEMKELEFGRP